ISLDELSAALKVPKSNAMGADFIHNQMLHHLNLSNRKILLSLFNLLFRNGFCPDDWNVWITGLLFKLCQVKVSGYIIRWLKDFLTLRRVRVSLNGTFSLTKTISLGVPQGAVLSPLLFTV
ncbi:Histone H1-like protein, partial [Daphnia magna]